MAPSNLNTPSFSCPDDAFFFPTSPHSLRWPSGTRRLLAENDEGAPSFLLSLAFSFAPSAPPPPVHLASTTPHLVFPRLDLIAFFRAPRLSLPVYFPAAARVHACDVIRACETERSGRKARREWSSERRVSQGLGLLQSGCPAVPLFNVDFFCRCALPPDRPMPLSAHLFSPLFSFSRLFIWRLERTKRGVTETGAESAGWRWKSRRNGVGAERCLGRERGRARARVGRAIGKRDSTRGAEEGRTPRQRQRRRGRRGRRRGRRGRGGKCGEHTAWVDRTTLIMMVYVCVCVCAVR